MSADHLAADPAHESPGTTRRAALAALAAGSAAALAPTLGSAAEAPRFGILGQRTPPISASFWIDGNGHPTRFEMGEVEGKWLYLKCFQSWCPGCHKHGFPALKTVSDAFAGDDRVAVIAVQTVFEGFTVNTRSKVREIQLRYGLDLRMGHDPGDPSGDHRPATMRRFRTGGTPWVVLADPGGRVVYNDYHVDAKRVVAFLEQQLAA